LAPIESELPAQSLDLSHAQAQLLGRLRLRQPPLQHAAEDLQSVQLFGAHRQGSRIVHVGLQARHGGAKNPTFLMVRNPTFLHCVYSGKRGLKFLFPDHAKEPRPVDELWGLAEYADQARKTRYGDRDFGESQKNFCVSHLSPNESGFNRNRQR
jgi:hypothetical protein